MICPNCNAQLPDDAAFCGNCGSPVAAQPVAAQPVAAQVAPQLDSLYQTQPAAQHQSIPQPNAGQVQPAADVAAGGQQGEMGMKWFKFVIYFQLFFSAVIAVLSGIGSIGSGISLGAGFGYPDWMPVLFFLYGGLLIAWSIFAVYVRFELAAFRRKAPNMYLLLLGLSLVINGLMMICMMIIGLGGLVNGSSVVSSLVGDIVLIVLNIIYFRKRQHLFVN